MKSTESSVELYSIVTALFPMEILPLVLKSPVVDDSSATTVGAVPLLVSSSQVQPYPVPGSITLLKAVLQEYVHLF